MRQNGQITPNLKTEIKPRTTDKIAEAKSNVFSTAVTNVVGWSHSRRTKNITMNRTNEKHIPKTAIGIPKNSEYELRAAASQFNV